jgi:hypothetical protein
MFNLNGQDLRKNICCVCDFHCTQNFKQIFSEMKLRSLGSSSKIGGQIVGIYISIAHRYMNVENWEQGRAVSYPGTHK